MRDMPEFLWSKVIIGSSLGMVAADLPLTTVGHSIVSPTTIRPRKYRKLCAAAGMDPTDQGWGFLRCLDVNGQRLTLMTEDVDYMELLIAGPEGWCIG
jgi:hypothetical protein